MARSARYEYVPPSYEQTVARAENKGSMFDNLLSDAKIYRPKQGVNLIRILPPGWPGAKHYGLTVMIHGNVGPNDRRYLCLRENASSPHKHCPVCDELYDLGVKATQEDRQLLRPKPSVLFYLIDRDAEKEGVQVWITSTTTESEIAAQSVNRRSKSVIDIVHPDEGYDVEFTRTGATRNNTRYRGYQISREPSPLSDSPKLMDAWLELVYEKPLPSLLQYYSPKHIEEVFYGKAKEENTSDKSRKRGRDEPDEDERPQLRRVARGEEEEERPRPRRVVDEPDEEVSPRSVRRAGADSDRDDDDDRTRERSAPRRAGRDERDDDDDNDVRNNRRSARNGDDRADHLRSARNQEEDRPTRSQRAVDAERIQANEDIPWDEKPPQVRSRSRLSEEIDDEIPERGARVNGATRNGEDEERPTTRRSRPRLDDDQETRDTPVVDHEQRRSTMRSRLDREAE